MRRNSYSSPTRPILVNDEDIPTTRLGLTPPTPPQDQTEAQRNLQQASASLEAAYRRIRHIRRNLLEVTGNMSTVHTLGRPSASESSTSNFDQNANRATDPVARNHPSLGNEFYVTSDHERLHSTRPSEARVVNSRPELPPLSTSGTENFTPPENLDSPHSSHRPYPFLRLPQLESRLYRRRDSHTDDPSTSLGRRVAAREAAGAMNSAAIHTTTILNSLPRFDANSAQLLAAIERDIEQFRAATRHRRSDPAPVASPVSQDHAIGLSSAGVVNRTSDNNIYRRLPQVNTTASSSPVGLHPDSRRHQLDGSTSSRPSISTERLSLLSNLSLQNLSSPVSAGAPRSLIFDEPSSYLRVSDFVNRPLRNDRSEESEPRNYVVRRRYNADGEEHVHPITLEWMDEPPPWIGPTAAREAERRVGSAAHGSNGSTSSGPPRRRGWARLDPDGNEIPSDEEEELERVRAQHRIQAQARSRVPHGAMDSADSNTGFYSLQATTTSAPLAPDEDAGIRVRLNAQEPWSLVGGVADSAAVNGLLVKGYSFQPPFKANPLPMPIEDMVWTPPKRRPPQTIKLPRHAILAGR